MRLMFGLIIVAAAVWLLGTPWSLPANARQPPPKASFVANLANQHIKESSGVAASGIKKGIYWTHNDSGAKAELFAFDAAGKDLATFTLTGINARDWEDIACARVDGKSYLYVGDIGDNLEDQRQVRIYRIPEPAIDDVKAVSNFDTYNVKYPDGPHNAEALMVAPDGDIYIVTKNDFGDSGLYLLSKPDKSGTYTLEKSAQLKIEGGNVYSHRVTGGDISPDGKSVVLRTYFSILLFRVNSIPGIAKVNPISLPVPLERQGEAICFDIENDRLLTTTEGAPCRVSSITLP
ncbi:MAG: WD40 repeat domain-containing protein [Fimbriimonadales bacterium]